MQVELSNIPIRHLALVAKGWIPEVAKYTDSWIHKGFADLILVKQADGNYGAPFWALTKSDWRVKDTYEALVAELRPLRLNNISTTLPDDINIDFSCFPDCQIVAFGRGDKDFRYVIIKLI